MSREVGSGKNWVEKQGLQRRDRQPEHRASFMMRVVITTLWGLPQPKTPASPQVTLSLEVVCNQQLVNVGKLRPNLLTQPVLGHYITLKCYPSSACLHRLKLDRFSLIFSLALSWVSLSFPGYWSQVNSAKDIFVFSHEN